MKTNNKIILGVSVILAVSLATGATATYAWFRVSRTANVNVIDTSLYGDGSSLSISYYVLPDSGALTASSAISTTKGFDVSGTAITDVSGDGKVFYKPSWDPTKAVTEFSATGINQVTNSTSKTYYVRFGIAFKNTGSSSFGIYLNDGCAVTPVTATGGTSEENAAQQVKNDRAAKTARLGFWDDGGATALSVWQPDITDGTTAAEFKYLAKDSAGTAYDYPGFSLLHPDSTIFHAGSFSHLATAPMTADPGQKVLTVASNSTTRAELAIWTEGTLALTTNEAQGGHLNVSLNFIAL